ncbi:MAG: NADH-quinone oxidoreductase subunit A [Gaiellaceae bacterium]
MLAEYAGVLLILAIGVVLAGALLGVHLLLGPRRRFESKLEPFECGEQQIVSPRRRYAVKFYLVAILFVLFDIEMVFLIPWAVVYRKLGVYGLVEMLVFMALLVLGLAYAWRRGALDWS